MFETCLISFILRLSFFRINTKDLQQVNIFYPAFRFYIKCNRWYCRYLHTETTPSLYISLSALKLPSNDLFQVGFPSCPGKVLQEFS